MMTGTRETLPWKILVRQGLRFNLVGLVNTGVDFGAFLILNGFGAPWPVAQSLSYSCGIATSYLGNKYWTFQSPVTDAGELFRFIALNLIAMIFSLLCLYLLHSIVGFSLVTAKVGATFLTMLLGFFGSRRFVFRSSKQGSVPEARW